MEHLEEHLWLNLMILTTSVLHVHLIEKLLLKSVLMDLIVMLRMSIINGIILGTWLVCTVAIMISLPVQKNMFGIR